MRRSIWRSRILSLIAAPLALALLITIWAVRPFCRIRIFMIPLRIGPLILDAVFHAQDQSALRGDGVRQVLLAYPEDQHRVNSALIKHLGDRVWCSRLPKPLLVATWRLAVILKCSKGIDARTPVERYQHFWSLKRNFVPDFDSQEQREVSRGFAELGISPGARVIAVLTRDPSYFETFTQNDEFIRRHEYRNCKIANYEPALRLAATLGFHSVRAGRASNNQIDTAVLGYSDYSVSDQRSDLMDLALAQRSEFIVTCSSGLDTLYWLCGKPFVGVNLPWLDGKFANYSLCLPKRMFAQIDGRRVELPVIAVTSRRFQIGLNGPEWDGIPCELVENSPTEIRETLELAIAIFDSPDLAARRRDMVLPLWDEFNRRVAGSNLHADARIMTPSMPLPDCVINRFFSTEEISLR